ncbi:MAG: hypothetical protein ACQKBU_07695 [Verrucomicrobiales bacterium]
MDSGEVSRFSSRSIATVGEFVRGFFADLEAQAIPSAVLHGWEDGFSGSLSDVDFAVDRATFRRLPEIIHTWCERGGWMLCQILRHETTAAYFVCASKDDPSRVVALDACSDYRWNGCQILSSVELLGSHVLMASGGVRVSDEIALCYRFAKAAGKKKAVAGCFEEFAGYSESDRRFCESWLNRRFGIYRVDWSERGLDVAFCHIRRQLPKRPRVAFGEILRIFRRVSAPTGLLAILSRDFPPDDRARLTGMFGHLYFRRTSSIPKVGPRVWSRLVASTLVLSETSGGKWARLFPRDCVLNFSEEVNVEEVTMRVVHQLHQRCLSREGLQTRNT